MYVQSTLALWTGAKSPAETTKKCIEITPAITDAHYFGIADTSCGPKLKLLLFCSHYNGHLDLGLIEWHLNSSFVGRNDDKQKNISKSFIASKVSVLIPYFRCTVFTLLSWYFSCFCHFNVLQLPLLLFWLNILQLQKRVNFIVPRYCGISLSCTPSDGHEDVHYNESWLYMLNED